MKRSSRFCNTAFLCFPNQLGPAVSLRKPSVLSSISSVLSAPCECAVSWAYVLSKLLDPKMDLSILHKYDQLLLSLRYLLTHGPWPDLRLFWRKPRKIWTCWNGKAWWVRCWKLSKSSFDFEKRWRGSGHQQNWQIPSNHIKSSNIEDMKMKHIVLQLQVISFAVNLVFRYKVTSPITRRWCQDFNILQRPGVFLLNQSFICL